MTPLATALRRLRPAAGDDAELLARYAAGRDPAAFEALVRRHGPMVLGVCRRVLGREADAEDAFQATFLVLARKAGAVRRPAALGNWLYGVAGHVARRARDAGRRRHRAERAAPPRPPAPPPDDGVVDEELARLPDRYRRVLVLCGPDGLTMRQAADALGWPPGTVATRLRRGRSLLAERLARRGVAVPAALAAVVPEGLVHRTIAAPPVAVASLAAEVARAMLFAKLKGWAVVAGLGLAAGAMLARQPPGVDPALTPPPTGAKTAGSPPEAVRAEVVFIQAGSPYRFRFPEPLVTGSLRSGDEDVLTAASSPAEPAGAVLTGRKPGQCVVTGTARSGAERGVLVVVGRPHLRLTHKLGEPFPQLTLPGGRKMAALRFPAEPPGVGLRVKPDVGFNVDEFTTTRTMKFPDGARGVALFISREGSEVLYVTDDRGLEWRVELVVRGAEDGAAKP